MITPENASPLATMMPAPTQQPSTPTTPRRAWWRRAQIDPVERKVGELERQGARLAHLAHVCAVGMIVLFSLGSLAGISGDSVNAIVAALRHGGMPAIPDAISVLVSTLLVVCCDVAMVYAALVLRLMVERGIRAGRGLYISVIGGVAVLEAGTYCYMAALYERPPSLAAWLLVIARALAAPLLSVFLSMARALPVTPRDMLNIVERGQGIQLVRELIAVANDARASLDAKMALYEKAATMTAADRARLGAMIGVVKERLSAPMPETPETPETYAVYASVVSQASAPRPLLALPTASQNGVQSHTGDTHASTPPTPVEAAPAPVQTPAAHVPDSVFAINFDTPETPAPDDDRPPTGPGSPSAAPSKRGAVRTPATRERPAVLHLTPDTPRRKVAQATQGAKGGKVRTPRKAAANDSREADARRAFAEGATSVAKMMKATGMSKNASAGWVRALKAERSAASAASMASQGTNTSAIPALADGQLAQ